MAVFGVLAAMVGLLLWLRSRGMAQFRVRMPGKQQRRLELLERLSLTPQHSLHMVRMDGRAILIAVSPSGCALLESGKTPREQAVAGELA